MKDKTKASFLSPYKIVKPYLEKQKPATLEVHPSYPCNYDCEWCIDKDLCVIGPNRDKKSMLTEKNVRDIVKSAVNMNIRGVIISGGGEPTLNQNTELLAKLCHNAGMQVGMFTNGSQLNEDNIPTYIENLNFIRFSFDDFNAESYSKTKGVPERFYYKVINNIRKCCEYRDKYQTDCRIGIEFVLIPRNISKMIDIWKKSLELGVDYLQFCDCVIIGYEFTDYRKRLVRENIQKILSKNDDSMEVVYEPLQQENHIKCKHCLMKEYIVQIGADGGVRPCPHTARRDEVSYGNINNDKLETLWKNRPKKLDTEYHYENCRFRKQNEILAGLQNITHEGMI